jgi:hypothetical protein
MIETRGERNHNPGNVERNATAWQGVSGLQSDSRFVVFADPHFGIRALAKVLLTYYRKHNLNTVRGIIDRWAPPSENNSGAYVNHVAAFLAVGIDAPLDLEDENCLEALIRAIIVHENGRCVYDDATIIKAVDSALA